MAALVPLNIASDQLRRLIISAPIDGRIKTFNNGKIITVRAPGRTYLMACGYEDGTWGAYVAPPSPYSMAARWIDPRTRDQAEIDLDRAINPSGEDPIVEIEQEGRWLNVVTEAGHVYSLDLMHEAGGE